MFTSHLWYFQGLLELLFSNLCSIHFPLALLPLQWERGEAGVVVNCHQTIWMACVSIYVCECVYVCVCVCGSLIKQGLGALSVYRRLCSDINTDWNREIIAPNKKGEVSLSLPHSLLFTHTHFSPLYVSYDIIDSDMIVSSAALPSSPPSCLPPTFLIPSKWLTPLKTNPSCIQKLIRHCSKCHLHMYRAHTRTHKHTFIEQVSSCFVEITQ